MADPVSGSPQYRDPNWLRQKYHGEGMSLHEIKDAAGVGYGTIWNWMDRHDIERRENANHVEVTNELAEILDGLLAGDGCLYHEDAASSYLHGDSYEEYVDWLEALLEDHGLETCSRWVTEGENWTAYKYRTRAYRELEEFEQRWYDDRKKRLPKDFALTPTTLLMWYVGDGSYIEQEYGEKNVVIYSDTFGGDSDRLERLFRDELGIEVTYMQKGIYVPTDHHDAFFEYMSRSPYDPAGYGYKFP